MIDRLAFSGLSVLVVDDDYNTTEIFSELLESIGLEVVGKGYSGIDAVALYDQHRPNIVFLDVAMTPEGGFCALEKIRQINDQAIVIMITADLRADTQDKLEELRASGIVYKPFDVAQILQTIEKLIVEKLTAQILSRKIQANRATLIV